MTPDKPDAGAPKELTAEGLANVAQALEPGTDIWVKVRNPKTGRFKAYRAVCVEPLDTGMGKWAWAIVAEYPPRPDRNLGRADERSDR